MADAVIKHFLESKEMHKGHRRKTCIGLQSTKTMPTSNDDDNDHDTQPTHASCPMTKQKTIFFKFYDFKDKAQRKMYTNQTGKFPKKSSHSHKYIMVLIEMDSNAILVAATKNGLAGKMICA